MHNTVLAMLECGPLTSVSAYILSRSKCALSASDQSIFKSNPSAHFQPLMSPHSNDIKSAVSWSKFKYMSLQAVSLRSVQIQIMVNADYWSLISPDSNDLKSGLLVPDQSRFK